MKRDTDVHVDPLLAELSELLHRMTVCNEDTPATRYAHQAIATLRKYEAQVRVDRGQRMH